MILISFVGEQFKEDDDEQDIATKREETSSISTDPAQAKTGQTLAVTGKGFSADSSVSCILGITEPTRILLITRYLPPHLEHSYMQFRYRVYLLRPILLRLKIMTQIQLQLCS